MTPDPAAGGLAAVRARTHRASIPAATSDGPPRDLRWRDRTSLRTRVRRLYAARGVLLTLTERDVRARYKRTALGLGWALLTPLLFMLAFTLFFRRVAHVDTAGAPYPLFVYLGLIPWTLFSTAVGTGSLSLLGNASLLNKVPVPREVFPLSAVAVATVDAVMSSVVLAGMFGFYGRPPSLTFWWTPVLLVIGLAFTVGVVLILAALVVYLRDLRHLIPLALQLGLFVTPVGYAVDAVPADLRLAYAGVDPLAATIDGLRRCLLYDAAPRAGLTGVAAAGAAVALAGGYLLFKRLEPGFADVA